MLNLQVMALCTRTRPHCIATQLQLSHLNAALFFVGTRVVREGRWGGAIGQTARDILDERLHTMHLGPPKKQHN